jgi:transcriptional antiterminator RfaH
MTARAGDWYVVQTQARAEAKALYNLRRQGYDAFLPQYLKLRRHARRTDRVPAPLFPRYLFVRIDADKPQWLPIRSTFGVTDIVLNGSRPAVLSDGVVQEIRRREGEDGYILLKPACAFRRGEAVSIVSGALANCQALFECATDEDRVILLLDLLGREVRVEVALDDIHAVE